MPFKLRLKSRRQYNVVSKNLAVLSVELLDNTTVECSLSADSSGQECLDNVCQRLGLQQPRFFGLWFVSKRLRVRWVDLEKPLKRQLEKHGQDGTLYLGVMYYVSDVRLLNDELTRYQYFLQLKHHVISGRLPTTQEDAVKLASYCLQAEFGDHDTQRHTPEYLKQFEFLPKFYQSDGSQFAMLTEEVALAHRQLQGLPPAVAETYYIMECQRLDGYGLEYFPAKDEDGKNVYFGVSAEGILIKRPCDGSDTFFKWHSIGNLSHQKRHLIIQSEPGEVDSHFYMDDTEVVKYIWKLCVKQHKFSMLNKYKEHTPAAPVPVADNNHMVAELQPALHLQTTVDVVSATPHCNPMSGSHMTLTSTESTHSIADSSSLLSRAPIRRDMYYSVESINERESVPDGAEQRKSIPMYRPAPDYATAVRQKLEQQRLIPAQSSPNLNIIYNIPPPAGFDSPIIEAAVSSKMSHHGSLDTIHPPMLNSYSVFYNNRTNALAPNARANLTASLDYLLFPSQYQMVSAVPYNAAVHDAVDVPYQQVETKNYSHYKNFEDLRHIDGDNNNVAPPKPEDGALTGGGGLPTHTLSVPELTSQGLGNQINPPFIRDLQMVYPYKPPPPYPYGIPAPTNSPPIASTSTPDLASQTKTNRLASNSSPDLLSHHHHPRQMFSVDPAEVRETHHYQLEQLYRQLQQPSGGVAIKMNGQGDVPVPPSPSPLPEKGPSLRSPLHSDDPYKIVINVTQEPTASVPAPQVSPPVPKPEPVNESLLTDPPTPSSKDTRCQVLESRLENGSVFLEFEQISRKKANADYTTALLPENAARNRFKDVLPYEENRVKLSPTKENRTGYINASHVSITIGTQRRHYIAAQGPLPNTVISFWQMVWELGVQIIVMLTEVRELGRDKCFPYWPQDDASNNHLEFGEFQIERKLSRTNECCVTSSLILTHMSSKKQRCVWHIQYTDWPDHGCPQDLHGFLSFMEEIDSVRRHAVGKVPPGKSRNSPMVVHCSAGVGRSGVTILCDIMVYCMDHNENMDVPKVLSHLRQQRMLTVQTLAQYKFVYEVLIQYLRNSRLI